EASLTTSADSRRLSRSSLVLLAASLAPGLAQRTLPTSVKLPLFSTCPRSTTRSPSSRPGPTFASISMTASPALACLPVSSSTLSFNASWFPLPGRASASKPIAASSRSTRSFLVVP
ncbi:hypothetical protein BN1723_018402, partial [Verticillium longisporum]